MSITPLFSTPVYISDIPYKINEKLIQKLKILNKDKNGNPVLSSNDVPLGTFVVTDGQGGFLFEN